MSTLSKMSKQAKGARFVKIGISIPTPLFKRLTEKVARIQKWRPEYNFSDYVRDSLRHYAEEQELINSIKNQKTPEVK